MTEKNPKQFKDEICQHFDVIAEGIEDEIKQVAEGVSLNTQKIDGLQKDMNTVKRDIEIMKVDMVGLKETQEIMKVDLEFIKNELKQKVNRDEFAFLEKRVSMLEAKLNQR
ncbi:MAG: hypothetical protein QMC93_02150 [Patescibacteria group bacterium]|nr:hypothetical protein [Patescibacteria group bacterium]